MEHRLVPLKSVDGAFKLLLSQKILEGFDPL